jgi:hypothetical protein
MLDFELRENTGGHGRVGLHVSLLSLPSWEPFEADVVCVNGVLVILCHDLVQGLALAKQHLTLTTSPITKASPVLDCGANQIQYLILTVRHVLLGRVTPSGAFEYTAPMPLFNGDFNTTPPSALAMDYLVWATRSTRNSSPTQLQKLPLEVQDIILRYTSQGTVEAARLGCMLGMGTKFLWKDGPLQVVLAERYYTRPPRMPVESELYFGKHKSGVVYLARYVS